MKQSSRIELILVIIFALIISQIILTFTYFKIIISEMDYNNYEIVRQIGRLEELYFKKDKYSHCQDFLDSNDTHVCTKISRIDDWCRCEEWKNFTEVSEKLIGRNRWYRTDVFWNLMKEWSNIGRPCVSFECDFKYCKCLEWSKINISNYFIGA